MTSTTKKITFAGMSLALAFLLPYLIGQIPDIGRALSPMHIPVLICGFICGGPYGLIVGFIAPLLSSIDGTPPIFPTGTAMAFELAAYGLASGLLYKLLPKKTPYIYVSLVLSMLIGRVVWGITMFVIALFAADIQFGLPAFLAGAFIKAVPGIILHIVLIPVIIMALKRARLMFNE